MGTQNNEKLKELNIGYFGASTGAAAALVAASELENIRAIVSRGGRPDLAANHLEKIHAPTLLIVGELDNFVIDSNQEALQLINARKKLMVIEGATHLFTEPGTLEKVSEYSKRWFIKYLRNESQTALDKM